MLLVYDYNHYGTDAKSDSLMKCLHFHNKRSKQVKDRVTRENKQNITNIIVSSDILVLEFVLLLVFI